MVEYFMIFTCLVFCIIIVLFFAITFKALSSDTCSSSSIELKASITELYAKISLQKEHGMKIDSNTEVAGKRSDQSQKDN